MADRITLQITGMREFELALDHWGDYLVEQAQAELSNVVDELLADLRRDIAEGQGTTRKSIKASLSAMGLLATIRVKGIAHLLEWGSKVRRFRTPHIAPVAPGVYRWVTHAGAMQPRPFFVKNVIEARKRFFFRMKHLLATPIPEIGSGNVEVRET